MPQINWAPNRPPMRIMPNDEAARRSAMVRQMMSQASSMFNTALEVKMKKKLLDEQSAADTKRLEDWKTDIKDPKSTNRIDLGGGVSGFLGPDGKVHVIKPQNPAVVNKIYSGDIPVDKVLEEADKVYGKGIGESVTKRFKMAEEGVNQNAQLDIVAEALDKGARTGTGEEFILKVRGLAETLGIDTGTLGPQETIRRVSNEMALRLRNPDSGLGLPGNTSNKDLAFLKESVVGLDRSERGNRAIIASMKAVNKMKTDVGKYQDLLIQQNGGSIPKDINTKILNYVNDYKVLTPKLKQLLKTGQSKLPGFLNPKDVSTTKASDDELLRRLEGK